MAIYIADSREPFAPAERTKPSILATSPAYYRLCRELERYTLGETVGRSFLISGHRGSGKTTLMLQTVEDTFIKLKTLDGALPFRVLLHGPDLLPERSTNTATQAPQTPEQGTKPPENGDKPTAQLQGTYKNATRDTLSVELTGPKSNRSEGSILTDDTHEVLKQITIGIYRSLAYELHRAYQEIANTRALANWSRWGDLPELAAQLRIELDGAPDLSRLREFWMRAGALSVGVLALSRPGAIDPQGEVQNRTPAPLDRGMAEIVALSSAAQAYRVVSGKLEQKLIEKLDTASKQSVALQTVSEIKNLLNPIIGLVAGVAVGYAADPNKSRMLAALAGTAAAVGTTVTLNYSSSRTRESTRSSEVTFLPDNTVNVLDRMLPLLVERCRQAGLAPVFVVDELDKIYDLSGRMEHLVDHLKYFVTERSFFCFLADRSYLEELRLALLKSPYGPNYTYFSDRLFVMHRPVDMHKYLGTLLQVRDGSAQAGLSDLLDLEVLRYYLLAVSRLHPFDLRRQLGRMLDERGAVSLAPGDTRTKLWYRFHALIQVAIEWLLESDNLRDRLQQDEDFTQVVYDTLYYPSRMWEISSTDLDLSKDKFFTYLASGMAPSSKLTRKEQIVPNGALPATKLSEADKNNLYTLLLQLVGFLADASSLLGDIGASKRFPAGVLAALPIDPKLRLLTDTDAAHRYLWRFDMYGNSVEPPSAIESILTDELRQDTTLIDRMRLAVSELTSSRLDLNRLAVEFNILSATPAWPSVQVALRRLRRLQESRTSRPYPEMEQDATAVYEYAQLLRNSGVTLACAIIAARLLGQLSRATETPDKIVAGLDTLTRQLSLATVSADETGKRVRGAAQTLLSQSYPDIPLNIQSLILSKDAAAWEEEVRKYLDPVDKQPFKPDLSQLSQKAEDAWRARFTQFFEEGKSLFDATSDDLFSAAAQVGLSKFLKLDLSEISLTEWSNLLISSLTVPKPNETDLQPINILFGMPSLFLLGFQREAANFTESLLKTPPPSPIKQTEFQPPQKQQLDQLLPKPQLDLWISAINRRIGTAVEFRPAALVVVLDRSEFMRRWKPSLRFGAVLVDQGKLTALRDALTPFWRLNFFNRILLEASPDDPDLAAQLQSGPSALFSNQFPDLSKIPVTYVFPRSPASITARVSYLVGPKNLDEAMEKLVLTTGQSSAV